MKLLTKSLLLIIVLFLVLAIAVSILSYRVLNTSLTREYHSKGQAIVRGVVDAGTETLLSRDLATVQATVDEFSGIDGVAYAFVTDPDNEIVVHTFVPAIPQQIRGLTELAANSPVSDTPLTTQLEVDGFGEVLHIYSPILAGAAGFAHVGMDLHTINEQIRRTVIQQQLLLVAVFVFATFIAVVFTRRIARPIAVLSDYTRDLARQDFSAELQVPDEIQSLPTRSRDEIGQLAQAYLDMENLLQHYIADLKSTTAAKERIESELNIAHDIQMGLVPRTFPPYPSRPEFDLYAHLIPAREVGGDFYDFFLVDENCLCFAIADVSDKGVPASLFMALTRTLLRALGREPGANPASIMTRLNREISEENDSCMFVTAFCGFLDLRTGLLEYCNAGHNLPALLRKNEVVALPGTRNMALGINESVSYESASVSLSGNELLFLYTDGITEAMNSASQQFGWDRLVAVLDRNASGDCAELIERVVGEVRAFAGDQPQSDDMTMLALRFRGAGIERLLSLELTTEDDSILEQVIHAWESLATELEMAEQTRYHGRLALEELVINISNSSNSLEQPTRILLWADRVGLRLDFELSDNGPAFDPMSAASPDTALSIEARQPGGLGLHLVRNTVQSFRYHRADDRNIVNFSLSLEQVSGKT